MSLQELELLEEQLHFEKFTNEDALTLGMILVNYAKERGTSIAVHIERNRIPLFTHLMEGTSEENVYWLHRKKRVVDHYNRSSYYIDQRFAENNLSHSEDSLLPKQEYQAVGGSFPIRVKGVGVIGSVTVAGLTGQLDHEYAVEGIKKFLAIK
ncbi:heme-degrading domain-containing protein [Bacillus kexueae]|uniref:heme-degrading domain-containing protein n=1 Tax=Aeribacillus kexueae TaxID=2078952 RepID=UPI001FAF4CFC|nr:heme-degrading domain-containing protein [Bacillus kexueae]